MIVVAGHLSIDPAQRESALETIASGVANTQAEEGNLEYRFSPDLQDPDRFNIIELWENEDAMNAHLATPEFAAFMEAIGPCIAGAPSIIRYDVASSSTLF